MFEVVQRVKEVNWQRQRNAPGRKLTGASPYAKELTDHPELALDYIVAPPRMALYMEYSTRVYSVYLKYIAPEDIIAYSIDEVMIDLTPYLKTYKLPSHNLVMKIMQHPVHQGQVRKNAILKVHSLEDGATVRERNGMIGGYKA